MTRNLLLLHSYRTPQIQNLAIPPIWLSYPTVSTYCCLCYGFLLPQHQNLDLLHGIFLDWYLIQFIFFTYLCIYFLDKGRNYVSFRITITVLLYCYYNITVLPPHNVIFFGYFMPVSHGVSKKTPPIPPPTSVPLPRFRQVCLLLYNKYYSNLLLL